MKYIITQHYTTEHKELFDITSPINKKYAETLGFEYISSNIRRCSDRKIWWEKIAWLIDLTNSVEDNSYIVYEDCDSINLSGDLKLALNSGYEYGMVQLRGGLGNNQLLNWYNAGVIIFINTPDVRAFLSRIWNRNDSTDETSINKELKSLNNTIGNSKPICSLDVKWNCWNNNLQHCSDVYIKSWHGMKYEDKLIQIKNYLKC